VSIYLEEFAMKGEKNVYFLDFIFLNGEHGHGSVLSFDHVSPLLNTCPLAPILEARGN
jgi:hypothetical protein